MSTPSGALNFEHHEKASTHPRTSGVEGQDPLPSSPSQESLGESGSAERFPAAADRVQFRNPNHGPSRTTWHRKDTAEDSTRHSDNTSTFLLLSPFVSSPYTAPKL